MFILYYHMIMNYSSKMNVNEKKIKAAFCTALFPHIKNQLYMFHAVIFFRVSWSRGLFACFSITVCRSHISHNLLSIIDIVFNVVFYIATREKVNGDDRDEAENQRVLDDTLTFFPEELLDFLLKFLQHGCNLLSLEENIFILAPRVGASPHHSRRWAG